jgi:UDP-N-acetylmuramate: L-alanyl-gamma-D-glutamyl-meso-diaminopimelate ligase
VSADFVPGPAERVPEPRPAVDWTTVKKVHLVGIGGSAMGNFAGMLQARGLDVRGSDVTVFDPMRGQLQRWAIPFHEGWAAANLDWQPDLVVIGNVVRRDNVEATAVRERGLPYCSFPEGLGEWFLPHRTPVVIAGTHGKTTTTSLTAWLLTHAGLDPGLLVGGVPLNLGTSFRLGTGAPFVIEGDEYDTAYYDKRPKFVHYRPHHGVLTSVEFDHADIYPDFASVHRAFRLYGSLFPRDGLLVAWGDDERVTATLDACQGRVARYGWRGADGERDVELELLALDPRGATFTLHRTHTPPLQGRDPLPWLPPGTAWGPLLSPIPGRHNVLNATAALLLARDLAVPAEVAREGLAQFKGVKKRQEVRGEPFGVTVIDDYAHHPTAVKETIAAIRAQYPGRRLWALFEAESNTSRRKVFEDVYPDAFAQADRVVLCQPLWKEGDKLKPEETMDAAAVCRAVSARGKPAWFVPSVPEIVQFVAAEAERGDVVLAMSGRDFQGLHGALLAALGARG